MHYNSKNAPNADYNTASISTHGRTHASASALLCALIRYGCFTTDDVTVSNRGTSIISDQLLRFVCPWKEECKMNIWNYRMNFDLVQRCAALSETDVLRVAFSFISRQPYDPMTSLCKLPSASVRAHGFWMPSDSHKINRQRVNSPDLFTSHVLIFWVLLQYIRQIYRFNRYSLFCSSTSTEKTADLVVFAFIYDSRWVTRRLRPFQFSFDSFNFQCIFLPSHWSDGISDNVVLQLSESHTDLVSLWVTAIDINLKFNYEVDCASD